MEAVDTCIYETPWLMKRNTLLELLQSHINIGIVYQIQSQVLTRNRALCPSAYAAEEASNALNFIANKYNENSPYENI